MSTTVNQRNILRKKGQKIDPLWEIPPKKHHLKSTLNHAKFKKVKKLKI